MVTRRSLLHVAGAVVLGLVIALSPTKAEAQYWCAECGPFDCELTDQDASLSCEWNGSAFDCDEQGICITPEFAIDSALLPDGTYRVSLASDPVTSSGSDAAYVRDCENRVVARLYGQVLAKRRAASSEIITI